MLCSSYITMMSIISQAKFIIFSFISTHKEDKIIIWILFSTSYYIIVKISSISTPAQVLQGMCNEDDNSSEIFLTFAPLKANDQDMSLRSSDQNIMKIPTDGFQEFNIIFAYFTFPSYLFIAQKRQRHSLPLHTQHNSTIPKRYGKERNNNSKLSGPCLECLA